MLGRTRRFLLAVGLGAVFGVLFGGVGARIVMSVLAAPSIVGLETSAGAIVGDLTFDGTLAVLGGGLALGLLGGIGYGALRPWLPPGRSGAAVYAALVLFAGLGVTVAGNREDFGFIDPALALPLFGVLLLAYGVALPSAMDRISPRAGRSSRVAGVAFAVLIGTVAILAVDEVVDAFELYDESPLGGGP